MTDIQTINPAEHNVLKSSISDSDSYSDRYASDTITPMLFYAGRPVPMWLSEDTDLPNAWGGGDPFPAAGRNRKLQLL